MAKSFGSYVHPKVGGMKKGPTPIKGAPIKATNPYRTAKTFVTRATGGKSKGNF